TPDHNALAVSVDDAEAAVVIATRWLQDALEFASRIGESEFEGQVQRCLRCVTSRKGMVERRDVARVVHLAKRTLDDVEATLVDRGLITVERHEHPGRPTRTPWEATSA